ncbi:MAG: YbaB/EbfC family nucleoid-associated protein [Planctomycetia bacterium]|nr:YbaB/EbfC family nucleoid-associated protein [Planctomycetia bacterium]
MFKELSQLAGLMKQLPKIKEDMENLQKKLGEINAEGDAGAGMVKVTVNGKMEVLACRLSDEALKGNDKEMLEDLIRAATNQALEKVRRQAGEETAKLATSFGLPPGFSIPGLGG